MGFFGCDGIDCDDAHGTDHPCALDDVECDTATSEDRDGGAGADLCGVSDGSEAGDDAATDEGGVFEGDVCLDPHHGGLGHAAEGAERGDACVVADGRSVLGVESGFSIGHEAGETHGGSEFAEGWSTVLTVFAAAAGGSPDGPDPISGLE